ncbi:MAG TPA: type II secretion system protein GspK [Pseudomonadota bacterium]|nr:type II secretion system protein GspK [Pseudomonadota bacterium]
MSTSFITTASTNPDQPQQATPRVGLWRRIWQTLTRRHQLRKQLSFRQRGIAILTVVVTTAILGATAADFAYNSQIELEAAVNSRDMLRAEYLARSGLQLGQLLTAVQGSLSAMMQGLPAEIRNMIGDSLVITDYAGFLAKAFGGDKEAREGLGAMVGVDLSNAEGMGTPRGTGFDLQISSEEGKYQINCAGGLQLSAQRQRNLYWLLSNLIRPPRYDRMFNISDRDGVVISREDLPTAVIDWVDVDQLRFNPLGDASASEDRYDRGRDRYEAHNQYLDTIEEMMLVRGISEDFWGAFGELFTVYGAADCKLLAGAMSAEQWPLLAAMIAAAAVDKNAVFDPNTALVAQQVAGILKGGLPMLKTMASGLGIPACKVDTKLCQSQSGTSSTTNTSTQKTATTSLTTSTSAGSDSIELLSNLICSSYISQLPTLAESMSSMTGGSTAPKPSVGLKPIPLCPGVLAQYLREKGPTTGTGANASSKNPRRFYRIDATGVVQRGPSKVTQVHIRGVWNTQSYNANPLCTNHPSCNKGTWMYFRID